LYLRFVDGDPATSLNCDKDDITGAAEWTVGATGRDGKLGDLRNFI
jgi:hypothetical protein